MRTGKLRRIRAVLLPLCTIFGVCAGCPLGAYKPDLDAAEFVGVVDNPFFPLKPGTRLVYLETGPDGTDQVEVTVLTETKTILGVVCTVVHDVVTRDGQITEDTFDWYAQHRDGTVWYFGEDTKTFEHGVFVGSKGAWEAGVDGARAGIIMEARPRIGDTYRQEYLSGVAEDQAEVVALDETVTLPSGVLSGCLKTREFTRLEPRVVALKYHAPGIGHVLTIEGDRRAELVSMSIPEGQP